MKDHDDSCRPKTLFGMSGAQLSAMQGGKMKDADQFPGYSITKEMKVAAAKRVADQKEKTDSLLDQARKFDVRIGLLIDAGIPESHVLKAANELKEDGDDSLIVDLARIKGIKLPDLETKTPVEDVQKLKAQRDMLKDMIRNNPNNQSLEKWNTKLKELNEKIGDQGLEKPVEKKESAQIDMSGWSDPKKSAYNLRKEFEDKKFDFMVDKKLKQSFVAKVRAAAKKTPKNDHAAVMILDTIATKLGIGNEITGKGSLQFKPETMARSVLFMSKNVVTMLDGLDAVKKVHQALADAGMPRTSTFNGGEMTGWTTHYGSTGFSIRGEADDQLEWNVVISGKPLLEYHEYEDVICGEACDVHEPINPEKLFPKIKQVFEGLGMVVHDVRKGGHQAVWDDDIEFRVETDHPEWLELCPHAPDPVRFRM